jgi:hypothetical protein
MKFFKSLNKFWVLIILSIITIVITRYWNQRRAELDTLESGNIEKAVETNQY